MLGHLTVISVRSPFHIFKCRIAQDHNFLCQLLYRTKKPVSPKKCAKLTAPIRDLAKCWKPKPISCVFPSSVRFDEFWSFIALREDSGGIN